MAAACEFPEELLIKPLGYVAVTGLQIDVNAMHLSIWETFTVNRRQEKVLNIKLVAGDYDFPKKKQKRSSYEFYVPKGILKSYWMRKHLDILPALVVVFYDLDWNDQQWREKQAECASRVAVIRSCLLGRNTKIAVVLIQRNMPLPPGEDPQAVQRAEALCQACELPSKSLFVLPFNDHLHGYITRLEGAFYEIAQGYYTNEARLVKQHKELLNKSQHQLLFIRHQFKIAFFSQLKQDSSVALKHYKQAYSFVMEHKLTDVNSLEVKVVAGFLNYKICKICFQLNVPLDSIAQFRKHIDFFKNKDGCRELAFEHSAWMAKQFSLFGELFQEAIKNGLQAIQTQHPGFYFQQAANHSMVRRQLCRALCRYSPPVSPNPLENANNLEFFGQRPWRQGCQANEPPDPGMEHAGIMALQAQELVVDHCWIIIPLLGSAVTQFREYKSLRMKLSLMVQMGEEYYLAKDYAKALSLLSRVTPYYRGERWWSLLTNALVTALRCSYLTANLKDYITASLELISKNSLLKWAEKSRLQVNLSKVLQKCPPEPEYGCALECVDTAKQLWKDLFASEIEPVSISMESLAAFVECRVAFDADYFPVDSVASLKVYVRCMGADAVNFSELGVIFSNAIYNSSCVVKDDIASLEMSSADMPADSGQAVPPPADSARSALLVNAGQVVAYPFRFILSSEDVGKKLEVKQVYVRLGRSAVLCWQGAGTDASMGPCYDSSRYGGVRLPVRVSRAGIIAWESVVVSSCASIIPRASNVRVDICHDHPALVDEHHRIDVRVQNTENCDITSVRILANFVTETPFQPVKAVLSLAPSLKEEADRNPLEITCGLLAPGEEVRNTFFLCSSEMGENCVKIQVSYQIQAQVGDERIPVDCVCVKEEVLKVETRMPFSVAVKIANLRFQQISKVNAGEPFSLMTYIKCTSPWPIDIVSSSFELGQDFKSVDSELESQIAGIRMAESHSAGECQCLVAPGQMGNARSAQVGHYVIEWKRSSGGEVVRTRVNLPIVQIDFSPFYLQADHPPYACVEHPLLIKYTFFNRTNVVQKIDAAMEPNELFMFSGNSQVQFRVLPHDEHQLCYLLYPLAAGELALPKLHVNVPQYYNLNCDLLAQQMLPTHIFVKPQPPCVDTKLSEVQVV